MSARVSLHQRIDDYLAERRRLGFELRSRDTLLASFARYVAGLHHRGPLTADLMTDRARQDKWQRDTPGNLGGTFSNGSALRPLLEAVRA